MIARTAAAVSATGVKSVFDGFDALQDRVVGAPT
jgi:hypothetical protein